MEVTLFDNKQIVSCRFRLFYPSFAILFQKYHHHLLHHIALYQKSCPLLSQNLVSRNKSEFLLFLLRVTSVAEKCHHVYWVTQKSNLLVFLQLLFSPLSYSKLFLRLQSQSNGVLVQDLFCSYKVLTEYLMVDRGRIGLPTRQLAPLEIIFLDPPGVGPGPYPCEGYVMPFYYGPTVT